MSCCLLPQDNYNNYYNYFKTVFILILNNSFFTGKKPRLVPALESMIAIKPQNIPVQVIP